MTRGCGETGEGWTGLDHCAQCAAEAERLCAQFDAEVLAGKYDAHGYSDKDRKKQLRKAFSAPRKLVRQ